MTGYWLRHRALLSMIFSIVVAVISVLLFVFPFIYQNAEKYNSQSIYKNSEIDFVAPEPSFEQINEFSNANGIDRIFPFFMTKTPVNVKGISRTTTILLSDKFENIDITMYNENRLIKKSSAEWENPILVDWQFCKDTSADIGDTISFAIGDSTTEYTIYAVYETNSLYEGGAILAQISTELKDSIAQKSNNNGYSGMYVSSSDYNTCQKYLTTDYRPMGRLKAREQFDSDEQYQIHYDAIMEAGYANEITDFRIKENNLDKDNNTLMLWLGTVLSVLLIIAFNVIMAKRGNEKGYFIKHCIPKGQNVNPFYIKSFVCEILCFTVAYVIALLLRLEFSSSYIPKSTIGIEAVFIPIAIFISEIISLSMNLSMISKIIKKEKSKTKK